MRNRTEPSFSIGLEQIERLARSRRGRRYSRQPLLPWPLSKYATEIHVMISPCLGKLYLYAHSIGYLCQCSCKVWVGQSKILGVTWSFSRLKSISRVTLDLLPTLCAEDNELDTQITCIVLRTFIQVSFIGVNFLMHRLQVFLPCVKLWRNLFDPIN